MSGVAPGVAGSGASSPLAGGAAADLPPTHPGPPRRKGLSDVDAGRFGAGEGHRGAGRGRFGAGGGQ